MDWNVWGCWNLGLNIGEPVGEAATEVVPDIRPMMAAVADGSPPSFSCSLSTVSIVAMLRRWTDGVRWVS